MIRYYNLGNTVPEDPASYPTPKVEPVYFWWSRRADIVALRKTFLRQWCLAMIELWFLIFVIASLYLGAGHDPSRYTGNLDVAVVTFDDSLASQYFLNGFRQSMPGNLTLGWRYKYADDYGNDIDRTRRDVEHGQVWATVVLRADTTRRINDSLNALTNGTDVLNSPFAALPPVLVTYEEGRNAFTINNFVLPPIRAAIARASAQYAQLLRRSLIGNLSAFNSPNNRRAQLQNTYQLSSLLADPFTAMYDNLRPASPFVGSSSASLSHTMLITSRRLF